MTGNVNTANAETCSVASLPQASLIFEQLILESLKSLKIEIPRAQHFAKLIIGIYNTEQGSEADGDTAMAIWQLN